MLEMHQYFSSTERYSFKNGQKRGSKNVVSIKNGKGFKQVDVLGPNGKVLNTTRKKLTQDEIGRIVEGRFLPGFWRNCSQKNCGLNAPTHAKNTFEINNGERNANKTQKNRNAKNGDAMPLIHQMFPSLSKYINPT